MEELINKIRNYHQMQIYTVNEYWCIQLFDHEVAANDQEDCIYECSGKELIVALTGAWEWVCERSYQTK